MDKAVVVRLREEARARKEAGGDAPPAEHRLARVAVGRDALRDEEQIAVRGVLTSEGSGGGRVVVHTERKAADESRSDHHIPASANLSAHPKGLFGRRRRHGEHQQWAVRGMRNDAGLRVWCDAGVAAPALVGLLHIRRPAGLAAVARGGIVADMMRAREHFLRFLSADARCIWYQVCTMVRTGSKLERRRSARRQQLLAPEATWSPCGAALRGDHGRCGRSSLRE